MTTTDGLSFNCLPFYPMNYHCYVHPERCIPHNKPIVITCTTILR